MHGRAFRLFLLDHPPLNAPADHVRFCPAISRAQGGARGETTQITRRKRSGAVAGLRNAPRYKSFPSAQPFTLQNYDRHGYESKTQHQCHPKNDVTEEPLSIKISSFIEIFAFASPYFRYCEKQTACKSEDCAPGYREVQYANYGSHCSATCTQINCPNKCRKSRRVTENTYAATKNPFGQRKASRTDDRATNRTG